MKNKFKTKRLKNHLKRLALTSTSHGLPNIFRTKRYSIKIMWLIFFVISTSLGVYMSVRSVSNYLSHNVITQLDVIYELPTQFPTVTFFNLRNSKSKMRLENLLIDCFYNDDVCNATDFDVFEDKLGFVSYRFKSRPAYTAGKINGLNLILYLNNTDYDEFGKYDGFQISVHNESQDPRYYGGFSYDGIDVAPGFATNLVIDRVFTYKLDEPFNNCKKDLTNVNSFESDIFKFMITSTNYSYRQKDCLDYCIGRELINKCNLTTDIDHWINVWLLNKNENNLDCFISVYYSLTRGRINEICSPACPLECDSITYEVSTSFSKFPNHNYAKKLILNDKINPNYSIRHEELSDNIISFNVYYNDLKYTKINQIPKIATVALISNIGGLFGLFIGVSFLSFGEVIELIFEIIFVLFENKKFQNTRFSFH